MAKSDLYILLNPSLGILKIGIATDVEARRRTLECGCGVPLEILTLVKGGERFEKPLHAALAPSRLLGEWFSPTPELFALVDAPDTIPAFLERMAKQVAIWEQEAAERAAAYEAEQKAIRDQLAAERRRLAKLEQQAKAKRDERTAKARAAREAAERKRVEEAQARWANLDPSLVVRATKPAAVAEVAQRRLALVDQRARNAAFLGVIPYETQRGATVGASELSQPSLGGVQR